MLKIIIGFLFSSILAQGLLAAEIKTRILDVSLTTSATEAMIFTETEGRVLWVDAKDQELLQALKSGMAQDRQHRIVFNSDNGYISAVQLLEDTQESDESDYASPPFMGSFNPSVISLEEATNIFLNLDDRTKWRSQCFNRAHGWAFDMWRLHNVYSMKMFIFFTKKYIEERKYKWWFHVAPYVLVQTENGPKEMIMDRSFVDVPTELKTWTDIYIKTKINCLVAEKYSDYKNNEWATDCYLIRQNMYYRSPNDLKYLETKGREELGWNYEEVREARKQAFKKWRDYYP